MPPRVLIGCRDSGVRRAAKLELELEELVEQSESTGERIASRDMACARRDAGA